MDKGSTSLIITAAGASTRFPGNKLLFEVNGSPIILLTIEKMLKLDFKKIIVVLGRDADKVFKTIVEGVKDREQMKKLFFVVNREYEKTGMSDSIKLALNLICDGENIAIHPADVPFFKEVSVKNVLENISKGYPITVACYNGRKAHPIIFRSDLLPELKNISEEKRGLKELVSKYKDQLLCVETGDPGTLRDIDTIEDIEEAKKIGLF